jgi:single-strand DNA-binding protein
MSRINNSFTFIGHLGADPEIRKLPSGQEVARLSLAVNSAYKDKTSGERVEKTDWFDLAVYAPGLIDVVRKYTNKGSQISVRGSLRKAVWDSKDRKDENGNPAKESRIELIVTEVQLLGGPRREGDNGAQAAQAGHTARATSEEPGDDPFGF